MKGGTSLQEAEAEPHTPFETQLKFDHFEITYLYGYIHVHTVSFNVDTVTQH